MAWTDEMVAELTKLWEEGLTTGEIGKKIGVSKNAVVGKAHRLGLKSRPSPIKRAAGKAPKKSKKNVTILDITSKTCRWPIGDPRDEDFHFCGKDIIPGRPYCLENCSEAYVKATKSGKNKKRVHTKTTFCCCLNYNNHILLLLYLISFIKVMRAS